MRYTVRWEGPEQKYGNGNIRYGTLPSGSRIQTYYVSERGPWSAAITCLYDGSCIRKNGYSGGIKEARAWIGDKLRELTSKLVVFPC